MLQTCMGAEEEDKGATKSKGLEEGGLGFELEEEEEEGESIERDEL